MAKKICVCPNCGKDFHAENHTPRAPFGFTLSDSLDVIELNYTLTCQHCKEDIRVYEPFLWTGEATLRYNPPFPIYDDEEDEEEAE